MSIIDKFNYYWFMRNVNAIIDSNDDKAEPEFIDDWLAVCEWLRPSSEVVSVGEQYHD